MTDHDKDPLIDDGPQQGPGKGRGEGKKFGEDNPPPKSPRNQKRGPQFRTLLLQALQTVKVKQLNAEGQMEEVTLTEELFIQRGLQLAWKDPSMYRDILARLIPYQRPTMPHFEFDFDPTWTPNQRIDAIMVAVAKGEIPIDAAHALIDIFKKGAEVQEISGILERLDEIERRQAEAEAAKRGEIENGTDSDTPTETE